MAKINYDFYDEKDYYSDGDIEDTILEYIKKYPNDYEKAFEKDASWPVVYHLSNARKNAISWYPFKKNCTILEVGAGMGAITDELCKHAKKVTSIELSKRRASAILMRNEDKDNLEIIVGNYNKIQFNEKYDYILLNGVLEYSALYIDSDNPYVDFINSLKKHLNKDGKILIAIENKFGLKYWCGADEDHTGKMFEGIRNYKESHNVKTFSKNELEVLAKTCGFNINYYYMFPDYKFPEIIYTDNSLNKDIYSNYTPYYCSKMSLLTLEKQLYKEIYNNKEIPFFANSYFIELSIEKTPIEVEYVKFNNYRSKEYNLSTYLKDNKFYKKKTHEEAQKQIDAILKIQKKLEKNKVELIHNNKEENEIYSLPAKGMNLSNYMTTLYKEKKYDEICIEFDKIYLYLKNHSGKKTKTKNNVLKKYHINTDKYNIDKLNFYTDGILDCILANIFVEEEKYILIDQEWYEQNVPIEYILYRAIINFTSGVYNDIYAILLKRYNLEEFRDLFNEMEDKIFKDVFSNTDKIMAKNYYANYKIIDNLELLKTNINMKYINEKEEYIDKLEKDINDLQKDIAIVKDDYKKIEDSRNLLQKNYENLENNYENLENSHHLLENNYENLQDNHRLLEINYRRMINSKGWKLLEKLRKIKRTFKK